MSLLSAPTAARCAAGLLGGVAAFQVALAAGAPWGESVYGGRADTDDGVLSPPYRVASAGAAVLLTTAAWTVAAYAGVAPSGSASRRALRVGTQVTAGYLALNTVGNLASKDPIERWVFGAVTAASSALCVVVLRDATAEAEVALPAPV